MPEGLSLGGRWGMECEGSMKVCKGQCGVRGQAWLALLKSTRAHSYAHACTPAALKVAFGLSNVELCIQTNRWSTWDGLCDTACFTSSVP